MNRDQALSKIKKCLALSGSSNPHEAAVALQQAQKLMQAHGISDSDVLLSDVGTATGKACTQSLSLWESALANAIAKAFGCQIMWQKTQIRRAYMATAYKLEIVFVGIGNAPEIAEYAWSILSKQCAKQRLLHLQKQPKQCKPITKTARADLFARGWVHGMQEQLDAYVGSDRQNALIESYMAQHHPDLKTHKPRNTVKGKNVTNNDIHQGVLQGRQANLKRGLQREVQLELTLM